MGASLGRLPAHMLFSDRDFTDADYDALSALDESIVRRGATPAELATLRVDKVTAAAAGAGDRCAICLEAYAAGAPVKRLPCAAACAAAHAFHGACIDRWLSFKASCPCCQAKVAFK
jgi:hypothetical protein